MSINTVQPTAAQQLQVAPSYEEKMSWSMRWFALIILSTGYIASTITGIIGFSITRDPRFLVFASPTLFTPAIYYLVPMDSRHFELKKLKIQVNAQLKAQRQQKKKQGP